MHGMFKKKVWILKMDFVLDVKRGHSECKQCSELFKESHYIMPQIYYHPLGLNVRVSFCAVMQAEISSTLCIYANLAVNCYSFAACHASIMR